MTGQDQEQSGSWPDYWNPDDDVMDALRDACEALEDRVEGVVTGEVAGDGGVVAA